LPRSGSVHFLRLVDFRPFFFLATLVYLLSLLSGRCLPCGRSCPLPCRCPAPLLGRRGGCQCPLQPCKQATIAHITQFLGCLLPRRFSLQQSSLRLRYLLLRLHPLPCNDASCLLPFGSSPGTLQPPLRPLVFLRLVLLHLLFECR